MPMGQVVQLAEPAWGEYVPAPHGRQSTAEPVNWASRPYVLVPAALRGWQGVFGGAR